MGKKSERFVLSKDDKPCWTTAAIDDLPAPAKRRDTYRHPELHHLVVIVTPKGTRTFYYTARVRGRPQRILIGTFPATSPKAAEKRAGELALAIAAGANPHRERRDRQQAPTLAQHWTDVFLPQHVARLKPRTQGQYSDTWKHHIEPALGKVKLADIERADVRKMHADIGAGGVDQKGRRTGGHRAANLAVAVLRAVLNHAIDEEHTPGPNPADRIKLYRENRRERFLSPEETARLYVVLQEDAEQIGDWTWHDLIKLALLTGPRKTNLLTMRWAHLDLEHGRWSIPRPEAKNTKPHLVSLPPGAVEILRQRRQADPEGLYVFPARRKGKKGTPHLVSPKAAWDRIRKRAGLTDVRFHDLRHTAASVLANYGANLQVIGHQLGHASTATTERYAHLVAGTVAAAVAAANAGLGDQE